MTDIELIHVALLCPTRGGCERALAALARVKSVALAAEQVKRETVERCARLADAERVAALNADGWPGGVNREWSLCAIKTAAAIRALLATGEPEPATGGKE